MHKDLNSDLQRPTKPGDDHHAFNASTGKQGQEDPRGLRSASQAETVNPRPMSQIIIATKEDT